FFFFQAEDGIRVRNVTGVQTCALPISLGVSGGPGSDTMRRIMAEPLPLVFDAPRRGLPPRHFADLDAGGRAAAMAELGIPAFREIGRASCRERAPVAVGGATSQTQVVA